MQKELDEEYMGLYMSWKLIMDPTYDRIVYDCYLWNTSKLKLGHNAKIFLVKIKRATGKEIAEHMIGPANVIPTIYVTARCAQQLIIIHRHWKVLKRVQERRERRKVH